MTDTIISLTAKQIIADVKKHYGTDIKESEIKNMVPKSYSVFVKEYKVAQPYANGWRRIMMDEIYAPRLTCNIPDIYTSDPYAQRMTEQLQLQIRHIPISYFEKKYNEDENNKFIGIIDVRNTSTEKIVVKSGDIKISQIGRYRNILKFHDNIGLFELLPGYDAKITVGIDWGYGYEHSSFKHIGPVIYKPTKFDTSVESKTLPSSASVVPTNYKLGLIGCPENLSARKMCLLGWKTFLGIVKQAKFAIDEYKKYLVEHKDQKISVNKLYESELLNVKNTASGIQYIFHHQSQTLTHTLAWIILSKNKIKSVMSYKQAPYDDFVILQITDDNHLKLIYDACNIAENEISGVINSY